MKISISLFFLSAVIMLLCILRVDSKDQNAALQDLSENNSVTLELVQVGQFSQKDIDFVCKTYQQENTIIKMNTEDFSQYNLGSQEELAKKLDGSADLKYKKYRDLYRLYSASNAFPSKAVSSLFKARKNYLYYRFKAAECLKDGNFLCSKDLATGALRAWEGQSNAYNNYFGSEGIQKLTNQCGFNLNKLK